MAGRLPKLTPAQRKTLADRLQGEAPNIYGSDDAEVMHSDPAYAAMQAAIERRRMRLSNESWVARWNRESGWTALTAEDAERMTKKVAGPPRKRRG